MLKTISTTKLRAEIKRVLNEVGYGQSQYLVEKFGEPTAAIINLEDFRLLQAVKQRQAARSLRETLAGAKASRDPQRTVAGVLDHIARSEKVIQSDLTLLFANPEPEDLIAARAAVHKLQFLDKCRRDAEALEGELDLGD